MFRKLVMFLIFVLVIAALGAMPVSADWGGYLFGTVCYQVDGGPCYDVPYPTVKIYTDAQGYLGTAYSYSDGRWDYGPYSVADGDKIYYTVKYSSWPTLTSTKVTATRNGDHLGEARYYVVTTPPPGYIGGGAWWNF